MLSEAQSGTGLPWVEKYRPRSIDDMHGQPHALPLLRHFCQPSTTQTIPHLLLFGPPGTGKTTAAHAICRHLLGADWRLSCLELNASDERGIQVVRERVKGFAGVKAPGKVKIVILDEADALTADAQTALRRVIEQFMLLCNQVSRVIEPLTSRCAKLRFAPIDPQSVAQNLSRIIAHEPSYTVTPEAVERIVTLANGDMRSAINLLQSACLMADRVDVGVVDAVSGDLPDQLVASVYQMLIDRKPLLAIIDTLNTVVYRQSYSANRLAVKLTQKLVDDVNVEDRVKARIAVYAGEVDGRGGNEYIHLLALVGCMHDAMTNKQ